MGLQEYFNTANGTGVLSTADGEGKVDAAIYSKPHIMEDGQVAIIMADRLSHLNLQSNPYAAYMFIEGGGGYGGKRLFLKKVGEEENSELLKSLLRRNPPPHPVDEVIKQGFGIRLPVLGPLETADMVGLDLILAIHDYIMKYLEASPGPSPLLRKKVESGELGFKSGRGFYHQWTPEEAQRSKERLNEYLLERLRERQIE